MLQIYILNMSLFYAFFATIALFEYTEFHGRVFAQIVEGNLVDKIEDYNFVVGLEMPVNDTHSKKCVAIIVSPWKILTAAHCVKTSFENATEVLLRFGTLNLEEPLSKVVITKDDIFVHPRYGGFTPLVAFANDIAVIFLRTPLIFGPKISKIDMVDEYFAPNEGDNVKMLGFSEGIGPNNTYKASKLRIVKSTVEDFEKCSDLYREKRQRILTKSHQFCVALRNHTKHNINKGDSGGPVLTSDEPPKLLGIISHGFAELPEVNVLVSGYRDFILNPRGLLRDSNNGQVDVIDASNNYVAAIVYTKKKSSKWFGWKSSQNTQHTCTATIISNKKIVTEADCVYRAESAILALETVNTDEPFYTLKISEEEIYVHPEYDEKTKDNNCAVIQLKTALKFGPKIGKIDLVDSNYVAKPKTNLTVFGFSQSNDPHRTYFDTNLQYFDVTTENSDKYQKLKRVKEGRKSCTSLKIADSARRPPSGGMVITKDRKFLGIFSDVNGYEVCNYHRFINNPRRT